MNSIFDYLNSNSRYSQVSETPENIFLREKFVEFQRNNKLPLQLDAVFIRSNACNTYLKQFDSSCYLIWDENYWDIIGVLLERYFDAVKIINDSDKVDCIMSEICGIFFFMLSIRFSYYPVFSKLLLGCAESLGISKNRFCELNNIAKESFFTKICKEFALVHESYHAINSVKDESYYSIASKMSEFCKSNLHNMTDLVNHSVGFIRQSQIEKYTECIYVSLSRNDSEMVDEIVSDLHSAIFLSEYLGKENLINDSSAIGVVYETVTRFMTFNLLLGFVNSSWNQLIPFVRMGKNRTVPFKPTQINLKYESALGMLRSWSFQHNFDLCIKKEKLRSKNDKAYHEYCKYRKSRQNTNDQMLNKLYSAFAKYLLKGTLKVNLIDLASGIENNAKSIFLSDVNSCFLVKHLL